MACWSTSAGASSRKPAIRQARSIELLVEEMRAGDVELLVVLGANWCHDSRALAARLYQSPLAEVVQENYELVLVDVGFYEQGAEITQEFGVPIHYATPTVLIIEPGTGQVVDNEDRHMWGNAYRVSMAESVEYFAKWADSKPSVVAASPELEQLYAEGRGCRGGKAKTQACNDEEQFLKLLELADGYVVRDEDLFHFAHERILADALATTMNLFVTWIRLSG